MHDLETLVPLVAFAAVWIYSMTHLFVLVRTIRLGAVAKSVRTKAGLIIAVWSVFAAAVMWSGMQKDYVAEFISEMGQPTLIDRAKIEQLPPELAEKSTASTARMAYLLDGVITDYRDREGNWKPLLPSKDDLALRNALIARQARQATLSEVRIYAAAALFLLTGFVVFLAYRADAITE